MLQWLEDQEAESGRRATPMIGGMLTAPLLSRVVIPAGYHLIQRRRPLRPRTAYAAGACPT